MRVKALRFMDRLKVGMSLCIVDTEDEMRRRKYLMTMLSEADRYRRLLLQHITHGIRNPIGITGCTVSPRAVASTEYIVVRLRVEL